MNSIDFGGHRSEVKATMGIIYKCGVRMDATLCVVIYFHFCWHLGNIVTQTRVNTLSIGSL